VVIATLYRSGSRLDLGKEARAGRVDRVGERGEDVRGQGNAVLDGDGDGDLETGVGGAGCV